MSAKQKRIMIVDMLNFFLRSYVVNPAISSTLGHPIGGVLGSLRSFQKVCREIMPDLVVICWDGENGSKKRRQKQKTYKDGRKPVRLNRNVQNLTLEEEQENKNWQIMRMVEYLNELPVAQFMFPEVEADDVIAFVKNLAQFEEWQKIIVSNDKDFIQLLDNKTLLYRPTQGEILNVKRVLDQFSIHPNNFALARAMIGDKSDNIAGIGGVGMKTAAKLFEFLADEKSFLVEDLISRAKKPEKKSKIYDVVLKEKKQIKENYDIMQLEMPLMSAQSKLKVKRVMENFDPKFNKTKMLIMLAEDGITEIDLGSLFNNFRRIKRGANESSKDN